MGRIIDRRRVMGGNLPYDAEIEYLESSGTQYIDTGIIPYKGLATTIDFNFTSLTNDQCLFGCWNGTLYLLYYTCFYNRLWFFSPYSRGEYSVRWKDNIIDTQRHIISLSSTGSLLQDDVILSTISNFSEANIGYSLYVFARNHSMNADAFSSMRCFSLKISNNDTLVRDFIPVRVGQVGYMYDKVSKQLFGNAGTREFILGPDK